MRRRRQKNPMLMRILGISILLHIIALPILARMGAFKKIQQQFAGPQVVFVPPPPLSEKERHEAKREAKHEVKRTQQVARRSGPAHNTAAHAQTRTNLNAPRVLAGGGGSGADGGGSVEQGSGKAGVVPTEKAGPAKPVEPVKPVEPAAPVEKPKPVEPAKPAEPAKPVEPARPVEKPKPVEPVKPAVREPVYVAAEPIEGKQPQPVLPDDLRADALDKTCVVEITVGADGVPTDVRVTSSTSVQDLDRLAVDAARKWRFKPATRDGQPVESRIRLHIEFQVS